LAFLPVFVSVPWLHTRGHLRLAPVLLMGGITGGLIVNVFFLIGTVLPVHYHFLLFANVAVAFLGFRRPGWLSFYFLLNVLCFFLAAGGIAPTNPRGLLVAPGTVQSIGLIATGSIFSVATIILWMTETTAMRSETELEQQAVTDSLTQLPNRRAFERNIARQIARVDRSGEPLALVLMDVDRFKQINDQHGHAVGDEVLAAAAHRLDALLRQQDNCARIGGEEFAVFVVGGDVAQMDTLCERLRAQVEQTIFATSVGGLQLTISLGWAQRQAQEDYASLFARCDVALYRAKTNGRNRFEQG